MLNDTAIKLLIGIAGTAIGALFVLTLKGAAVADAEGLHAAKARTDAIAATRSSGVEEIAALAARLTTWPPRAK